MSAGTKPTDPAEPAFCYHDCLCEVQSKFEAVLEHGLLKTAWLAANNEKMEVPADFSAEVCLATGN